MSVSLFLAGMAAAAQNSTDLCSMSSHINNASLYHIRRSGPAVVNPPTPGVPAVAPLAVYGNGGKILGYTRLKARYVDCGATQRIYGQEKRNPLLRFFLGKETHKALALTVKISPLDVKSTNTLARFDRLSGRKGEEWTTSVENDRILLPYFRVDLSSTVDLQSEMVSTREYNSSIVAGSFEVVEKAAALIAPSTILITEENKSRFNDAANFIDSSVNGLLRVSITERLRETKSVAEGGADLAVITLVLPRSNDAYVSTAYPERPIGQWRIYAEAFRPSLFGEPQGQSKYLPEHELSSSAILSFLVNDTKSLRESLNGAASVTSARDALVKATGDGPKAVTLCRAVSAESDRIGLTPIDASAAAWAYITDMGLGKGTADDSCRANLEYYPS